MISCWSNSWELGKSNGLTSASKDATGTTGNWRKESWALGKWVLDYVYYMRRENTPTHQLCVFLGSLRGQFSWQSDRECAAIYRQWKLRSDCSLEFKSDDRRCCSKHGLLIAMRMIKRGTEEARAVLPQMSATQWTWFLQWKARSDGIQGYLSHRDLGNDSYN